MVSGCLDYSVPGSGILDSKRRVRALDPFPTLRSRPVSISSSVENIHTRYRRHVHWLNDPLSAAETEFGAVRRPPGVITRRRVSPAGHGSALLNRFLCNALPGRTEYRFPPSGKHYGHRSSTLPSPRDASSSHQTARHPPHPLPWKFILEMRRWTSSPRRSTWAT